MQRDSLTVIGMICYRFVIRILYNICINRDQFLIAFCCSGLFPHGCLCFPCSCWLKDLFIKICYSLIRKIPGICFYLFDHIFQICFRSVSLWYRPDKCLTKNKTLLCPIAVIDIKTDNLCIVTMFFSTGILIPGMGIRHLIGISGMTCLSKAKTKCSLTTNIDLPPCSRFCLWTDIDIS